MNKLLHWVWISIVLATGCVPNGPSGTGNQAQILWANQQNTTFDFSKADSPRAFSFPADHGAHPDYQTEWWYFTGNLSTDEGREFGYQLTFFRRALTDTPPARQSEWATENIYMAHYAITDVAAGKIYADERFSRDGNRLAGAETTPYAKIWLEGWSAEQVTDITWTLQAENQQMMLALDLTDLIGPVLQGDAGLSRKGEDSASYYYSLPKMETTGMLRVGTETYKVQGLSWMDHEFSTSVLSRDQIGWDWYAIQLDDGSQLMMFTLRRDDGSMDPYSSLSLINVAGEVTNLPLDQWQLTSSGEWQSPHSGARYPSGWKLKVPGENLILQIQPRIADQELNLSVVYWEGAVTASGTRSGEKVSGSGYVELTGYAQTMEGL